MAMQVESTKIGRTLKWAAIFSILLLPIAVVCYRLNFYDFSDASKVLTLSLFLSAIIFLFALLLSIVHRKSNPSNSKLAAHAWGLSLMPLIFFGSQIIVVKSVPMIHNISTDVNDPPEFFKVIELRGVNSNPHEYDQASLASIQREAYPNITTLFVDDSIDKAFKKANQVVALLEWDIVSRDVVKGVVEATETSGIWQFKDDVVIRIKVSGDQTKIDLRSVSRVGRSDLGANAKRIEKFLETYKLL